MAYLRHSPRMDGMMAPTFDARTVAPHVPRRPENCFAGGGMAWAPSEGGGGGGSRNGLPCWPFVLCKDGCCHQRRRNTNFGPEKFFPRKNFPPHMCSQNDQRDVGIHFEPCMLGSDPPPPARQVGQRQPKPPSRHGDQGGGGGGWANGLPPPPRKAIFFPPDWSATISSVVCG